jgi:hypothetical protein
MRPPAAAAWTYASQPLLLLGVAEEKSTLSCATPRATHSRERLA